MPKIDKDWNPGRATQFSSTNQPKGRRGRKPKLKSIPDDAREKVYSALYHALTLPDKETAVAYLNKKAEELPEFGYLIQVYAKGMLGKFAVAYVSDLLDRLFGKPKQVSEITADVGLGEPPTIVFSRRDADKNPGEE